MSERNPFGQVRAGLDRQRDRRSARTSGSVEAAWPVESVFRCATAEDPSELLGFGTWMKIGTENGVTVWRRIE